MLDAHPDVVESAVFGVPDDDWGQRVVAAYVGTPTPAELGAWARERLAPAKRPKSAHRLDELPRTSTGKVRRLDLPGALGLRDATRTSSWWVPARPGARWPPGWWTPAATCCCWRPAPTTAGPRTSRPTIRDAATMGAAVPGHPANWDLDRRADRRRPLAGAARQGGRWVQRTQRHLLHPGHPGRLRRLGGRWATTCGPPTRCARPVRPLRGRPAARHHRPAAGQPRHRPAPDHRRVHRGLPGARASRPSRTRTPTPRPASARCRSPCATASG